MSARSALHPACPWPALPPPINLRLYELPESPCPYLPGRLEQCRAFLAAAVAPHVYHQFMDAGFRRSGELFYQPVCRGCRACMPIRIPVDRFAPGKSQRRCFRRNSDLRITFDRPSFTEEKYDLYCRYVTRRHRKPAVPERDEFQAFLCTSPVETVEMAYRDSAGRLLAVGVCDVCADSLSSVYFYFDPDHERRGLGTFGAMVEIRLAQEMAIPYYYLGYWVSGCRSMEYKSQFRPFELLHPDGVWREGIDGAVMRKQDSQGIRELP